MSPRKRLSPTTQQPTYSMQENDAVACAVASGGSPLVVPNLGTTTTTTMPRSSRSAEEHRLMRLLCWLSVLMTMAALLLVAVVEHEHARKIMMMHHNGRSTNRRPMNLVFETHSHQAPFCTDMKPDDVTFTLVTQCTDSRLWMLEHHCARWSNNNHHQAPISLVVYTNRTLHDVERQLRQMHCDDQVTVQVHPADTLIDYPINTLRNMALQAVKTSHAVYMDVDFWPSADLQDVLSLHKARLAADYRQALVVPAFALQRQCAEWRECPEHNLPLMPANIHDVFDGLVAHRLFPFDPTNRGAHGSTRYQDWLSQSADDLLSIPCFQSQRYEPYLVVRHCDKLPPFQEGFVGYGKNKVSWVMQLRRAGWLFDQIGVGFLVHYPHLDSPARQAWNGEATAKVGRRTSMMRRPSDDAVLQQTKRGVTDQLFVEFRDWLDENYPAEDAFVMDLSKHPQIRTPLCDDGMDDDSKLWVARETLL